MDRLWSVWPLEKTLMRCLHGSEKREYESSPIEPSPLTRANIKSRLNHTVIPCAWLSFGFAIANEPSSCLARLMRVRGLLKMMPYLYNRRTNVNSRGCNRSSYEYLYKTFV